MSHQAESETSREKSALFLGRLHESLAKNKLCNEVIARAVIERLEVRQEGDLVVATIRDFIYEGFIRQPSVHSEMKALTREVWGEGVEFLIVSGSSGSAPRKRARKTGAEAKAVVDPLFEAQTGGGLVNSSASATPPVSPGVSTAVSVSVQGASAAGPAFPVLGRTPRADATARAQTTRSGRTTTAHLLEQALSAATVGSDPDARPPSAPGATRTRSTSGPGAEKSERTRAQAPLPSRETNTDSHATPPPSPVAAPVAPHAPAASSNVSSSAPSTSAVTSSSAAEMSTSASAFMSAPVIAAEESPATTTGEDPAASGKGKKSFLAALGNINKMSMPNPVTAVLDATDYETRSSDTPERALDPEFTFQTFVQGTNNEIASQACLNAARNPGNVSNPVFIYGSTGLGKTHLLHAVGNEIQRNRPDWHVRYVTSEDFVLDFMRAVRHNKHHEFRNKYRQVDVLLVDDIQFLEKKDSTQLEFFHTFNELYQSKKQIVITSDQYPKTIPNIEERLKSRFLQGLIASIEPPTFEDRVGIIEVKASTFGLKLRRDHIEFIATHVKSNVREITGVLKTLLVNQSIKGEAPSLEAIQQLLRKDMRAQSPGVELLSIQKAVATHFGIKFQDLMSSSRKENFVLPRHVAMYLARDMLSLTTTEIALAFGRKDHTTVLNAVKRVSDLIEQDASTLATVKELRRKLEHAAH